jgi:acetyltransferase
MLALGIEKLDSIFNPKSIAVIGASEREGSIGAKILRNLVGTNYKGAVFPVNPFRQTVQGMTAFPSVCKIPQKVDLAIIATPAHTVPQIVDECGKAGVSGIIIISAGFRGTGDEGALLEKNMLSYQEKFGVRIIGPNSFGVIRPKIELYATFAEKQANSGKIAFISQSAALCASALDWAWDAQIGFSAVVSTGSTAEVDLADLIDYFGRDAQTKSIVLYIESIRNPRKFVSAARDFARTKPIVLIKAGRFQESIEAALSHSGSLTGEDAIYDAAFRRAGIVRVETINDLFNCAEALAMQPNPAGPNLTIITNAGGPAIMATDHLIYRNGSLAHLSPETIQALRSILPPYCSLTNPIDIYEESSLERFKSAIEICLKDPHTDGFLVIYTPQGATDSLGLAETIAGLVKETKKPFLTALMSEDSRCREARRFLRRKSIPSFTTPEEAVSAFMYMYNYTQNLELLYQTPKEFSIQKADTELLKDIIRRAFCEGRIVLSLPESVHFLEEYKIPVVKTFTVRTSEEAAAFASRIGYPVVMKVLSPKVIHKSKIKGVVLNICSPLEIETFFNELQNKIKNLSPTAAFQGVAIQPMLRERGTELLVGAKRDAQFGPVIVFGMGGTSSELFKDVSIGFPPLNQVLAKQLIEATAIARHAPSSGSSLNLSLLEEVLVKFSQLILDFPEIQEMDINPLIVTESEVVAVDTRIVIDGARVMREASEHSDQTLIAAYPKEYVASRKLKNGVEVVLRPIRAEDEGRFNELIKSLSAESMMFRFFNVIKEMPHETLTKYCNLDYDRQIAIVAEMKENNGQIIGVGRVIVEPDGKNGEFAVLVHDKWQGLGLGSMLMDYIILVARNMRLERVFAYILSKNYRMAQLCKKKGFEMETLDEETVKGSLILI